MALVSLTGHVRVAPSKGNSIPAPRKRPRLKRPSSPSLRRPRDGLAAFDIQLAGSQHGNLGDIDDLFRDPQRGNAFLRELGALFFRPLEHFK